MINLLIKLKKFVFLIFNHFKSEMESNNKITRSKRAAENRLSQIEPREAPSLRKNINLNTQSNRDENTVSSEIQIKSNEIQSSNNNSQEQRTIFDDDLDDLDADYSLNDLMCLAKSNKFPKKLLSINGKIKRKTAVLHFFKFTNKYKSMPAGLIDFVCKINECKLRSPINDFSNLNKHLLTHKESKSWYDLYIKRTRSSSKLISDESLKVVKYFISSDTALDQMNNIFLREILDPKIKIYSFFTFRYKILDAVINQMYKEIERRLNEAEAITLLTDGWTGQFNNVEYIGLGAQLINHSFEKELIIIGMLELENGHSAVETKKAIESMVNKYDNFDKSKIKGRLLYL